MTSETKRFMLLRVVLPPLLGAVGALSMTVAPVYHAAFCSGQPLQLIGG